jgi:protein subunit release factor B
LSKEKTLLFSLTKKDFEIQFYRAGGCGGQNVNKVETACRIRHPESGAVGESQTYRTQLQNKKAAFERLTQSETFKTWHKMECAKRMGQVLTQEQLEEKVDKMMSPENLKIEYL